MTTQLDRESVSLLRGVLDGIEDGVFSVLQHTGSNGVEPPSLCRERVERLCSLYERMMVVDVANELDWVRGVAGCDATNALLHILWSRWLALADNVKYASRSATNTLSRPMKWLGSVT